MTVFRATAPHRAIRPPDRPRQGGSPVPGHPRATKPHQAAGSVRTERIAFLSTLLSALFSKAVEVRNVSAVGKTLSASRAQVDRTGKQPLICIRQRGKHPRKRNRFPTETPGLQAHCPPQRKPYPKTLFTRGLKQFHRGKGEAGHIFWRPLRSSELERDGSQSNAPLLTRWLLPDRRTSVLGGEIITGPNFLHQVVMVLATRAQSVLRAAPGLTCPCGPEAVSEGTHSPAASPPGRRACT